ncbi:hypothetical protein HY633_03515 [Candidatus Uhrbacteria bacterium]|nr:hypothetical protein [Candidatus Uhrbacteria bacterium]
MAVIEDHADWTGIQLTSIDVGARHKKKRNLIFRDIAYATMGEVRLARLLAEQGIPFTPNVLVTLHTLGDKPKDYVPDFILNGMPYLWEGKELIHGFEAKGVPRNGFFAPKALARVEALQRERNIVIKLISDREIIHYFEKSGRLGRSCLPLRPLVDE